MKRSIYVVAVAALLLSANADAALLCQNPAGDSITWTVGQPVPSINVSEGVTCAANGAELDAIRTKFSGIPMRNGTGRVVLFRGDVAVFIVDNL